MTATEELFKRIEFLEYAINQQNLIDIGIANSEHNGAANLLRKGLAIVAFNVLEDFVKNKAVEALKQVSDSGIDFSHLTQKLQDASTFDAIKSLAFQAALTKKEQGNWKKLIQDESLKIHSTIHTTSYEFSKFSLLSSSSNIIPDDIKLLLSAFGIDGGWDTLRRVSNRIGGGIPDLKMSYCNAAERRNNSAHSASYRYEYSWLTEIKREIISISASIDIILTARCRQIKRNLLNDINIHNIDTDLNFRFLEEANGKYRETTQISGRARKVWDNLSDAVLTIKPRIETNKEFLIVLNSSKNIDRWYC